jgi:hypothetical protein
VLGEFACSKNGLPRGRRSEGWHTTGPSSSLACNLHVIEQQRGTRIRTANRIAIKEWIDTATSASLLVVSNNETHSGATKNNCHGAVGWCGGVLLPSQAGHAFNLRPARDAGRPGEIGSASLWTQPGRSSVLRVERFQVQHLSRCSRRMDRD